MNQNELKRAAARAALDELVDGAIVGVGSGSTVEMFIDALHERRDRITGAVASSERSAERLRDVGIVVLDLNQVIAAGHGIPVYVDGADEIDGALRMIKGGGGALTREKIVAAASGRFVCIVDASKCVERLGKFPLPVYVDGADEVTEHGAMIKGGGGALTREKIVAAASRKFVCIVDGSKLVDVLGKFPLPVEVIPMARSYVARELVRMGGQPELRQGFTTDNGNVILDVRNLKILEPAKLETELNQLAGVVTVGLFARRGADTILIGGERGVRRIDVRR